MSAPRNRERAPTGHRASNCLLSTNEMTHFGNDRGFEDDRECGGSSVVSVVMDLQNGHFIGHLFSDRYVVLTRGTYVNRGESARSCLSPGTGNGH